MSYTVYNKPKNKGPRILAVILLLCAVNFIFWLYKNGGGSLSNGVTQLASDSAIDNVPEGVEIADETDTPAEIDIKMKGTCYHYKQLDKAEKQVYQYLYQGFKGYESKIKIIPTEQDSCHRALYAFRMDHPEFFWAENMNLWSSSDTGLVESFSVTVPKDAKTTKKQLQDIADQILSGAPEDDYGKV